MNSIPHKLASDPITDCTVEIRFAEASEALSDVLPGLLFQKFKSDFPRTETTPASNVPKAARQVDVNLMYQPVVRLVSESAAISIAEKAMQISFRRPYPGWDDIRPRCEQILGELFDTSLVQRYERLSIRYLNLITIGVDVNDLSHIELDFRLCRDLERRPSGVSVRSEFEKDDTVTIVQVQNGADATVTRSDGSTERLSGTVLDIDTISFGHIDSVQEMNARLGLVRRVEREVFFRSLTKDAVSALGPSWEK